MRVKLSEILTQSKTSEYIDHPENEKFVTVSGHGLGVKERKINDGKTPVQFNGYRIKEGQLVYSRIGASDGAFGIVPQSLNNAVVSKDFPVFNVDSEKAVIDYLVYFLTSDSFCHIASKESFGATMTRFKEDKLLHCEIALPSKEEQAKIVTLLNAAKHVIALRQQELQKLDDLVKARFVEMFGDMILNPNHLERVPLGKVCDVRDGTHDSPQYCAEGYPLVTSKNVTGGHIDMSGCNLICKEDYDKINERSKVDYGDILMPMIGTVGKPVVVDIVADFAIKNVALIKFHNDSLVNNIFVKTLLESDYFDRTVISKIRGGTQKFISLGDIRGLEIYLPPMASQIEFSKFVKQIDKSKFVAQKALDEAQLLFDSLMQKYFG